MKAVHFLALASFTILISSCQIGTKWEVKITSPVNNTILTSESNIVPEVKGYLNLTEEQKKNLTKPGQAPGEITCNGVKATFMNFSTWEAKDVPITEFKENNLACEFKNASASAVGAITILKNGSDVPDPGEAGRTTLEGIDVNNDGVRDDVEIWINKNYTDPDVKNAMRQMAQASQKLLIESESKEKTIENTKSTLRSLNCLMYIKGFQFMNKESDLIQAEMLNTKERVQAEFLTNEHFNGQSGLLKDVSEQDCNFKILNKKSGSK